MRFFSNTENKSNISNISNTGNIERVRLRLREPQYKLSKSLEYRPVINTLPPPEEKDFITQAIELFSLELVGYGDKIFTEEERYIFDERAGIYEYEAELSRAEAEKRAYNDLSKIKF